MALTLTEIVSVANNFTDENITVSMGADFYNEAISRINAMLLTQLPYINKTSGDYATSVAITSALDETWQRRVVIPFVCYSIKINDGSMNEASYAFIQRFQDGMKELKLQRKSAIDINYRVSWKECTYNDYISATNTQDINAGVNLPSSSYLANVAKDLSLVVKIYNDAGVTRYYKLTEQGASASIRPIGSKNVGWF